MTQQNHDDFFENLGGSGAPSAKLTAVDDFVIGEIVDQFKTEATDFATKEILKDSKTGQPVMQLVIVLQTDLRNWQGVARIPKVDKDDRSSADKPASDDDGKRAVYVKPWTNIHAAVGKAVIEATGAKGGPRNGGKLGVKVVELKDTGKGNPLKVFAAHYEPPVAKPASDGFFDQTAQTAPVEQPAQQQAAPQETAPAAQPAAQPAQETAPVTDPWSGQPVAQDKPPF